LVKRLIINADDFGLTSGVNQAIVELHGHGMLTSATLMARASATDEAIRLALANPTLGVGCHVVLVDGQPVLSGRDDIPWLADPTNGRLRNSLSSLLSDLYQGRLRNPFGKRHILEEIQDESAAQIALLQKRGLHLTHIDTHKHTHMFPKILRPVLRAARAAGIRTIRNPYEPAWSVRATPGAPWLRRAQVNVLRTFQSSFRRIVAEEGFVTTDGAIGVLATGTLDSAALASLLNAMPDGIWELVTHPGYNDTSLARVRTRLLASRETEYEALKNASISQGIELIHFGQLR
jgi:hopanoid biosynthesis associated protein HpnK